MKCPGCGGELRYDIASRQMRCDYCSQMYDPYQFDQYRKSPVEGVSPDDTYQTRVWICPNCGAQLTCADDTDVTATCAYCGSANIIFSRIKEEKCPETIIPFSVTKEECGKAYKRALRRAFLSPRSLMRKSQIDSFRGIYMPYWEYVAKLDDPISVEYKKSVEVSGDYTNTTIHQMEIKVDGTFAGISHDASRQFDDDISECLDPFPRECEQPFTPGYLCGFYAETDDDDVNKEYKDMAARLIVEEIVNPESRRKDDPKIPVSLGSSDIDRESIHIPDEKITAKRTLFPVWFMSYRRNKNNLLYAAVNGSTGKVVADFPISIGRFLCMTLLVAAVLFAFMNRADFMGRPLPTFAITAMLSAYACRMNGKFFAREKALEEGTFPSTGKTGGMIAGRVMYVLVAAFLAVVLNYASNAVVRFVYSVFGVLFIILLIKQLRTGRQAGTAPGDSGGDSNGGSGRGRPSGTVRFFSLLTICATVLSMILIRRDVRNHVYYWAALGHIALFLIQFCFTVRTHNQRAYRRPPQFNKRGGDDRA